MLVFRKLIDKVSRILILYGVSKGNRIISVNIFNNEFELDGVFQVPGKGCGPLLLVGHVKCFEEVDARGFRGFPHSKPLPICASKLGEDCAFTIVF